MPQHGHLTHAQSPLCDQALHKLCFTKLTANTPLSLADDFPNIFVHVLIPSSARRAC
ncbi:hypothetical protein C7443_1179 [Plasticicumulans acidivorans]|uniref:Uncharacterized protein n=1 Tax=Plasticicumulans acidivorans TaxID=886464 RepID=A0A317MQT3_9GAMM|nr:hypothetical protein C7443_1179 [Plasticicumulans acidivorans]